MFETGTARRAAEKAAAADLLSIAKAIDRQKTSGPGSGDFVRCTSKFRHAIAKVSSNPVSPEPGGCFFARPLAFHAEEERRPGLEDFTITEHGAILGAVSRQRG
jgi:DNA-binding FadR family transcriptional regulator